MARLGPARLTGIVYLAYFVVAIASGLIAPGINGPGPLPEPSGIAAHRLAYEVAVALGLASTVLYVAVAGLLYRLLQPVGPTVTLLALLFALTGCAVTAFGGVFQLGLFADGMQGSAGLLVRLNAEAGHVALVFFGAFELLLGYTIVRSTFLPRAIGALIVVAGVGWLAVLSPVIPGWLATGDEVVGFAAEAALMLWLLLAGVNERRWTELRGRQPAAP